METLPPTRIEKLVGRFVVQTAKVLIPAVIIFEAIDGAGYAITGHEVFPQDTIAVMAAVGGVWTYMNAPRLPNETSPVNEVTHSVPSQNQQPYDQET